MRTLLTALFCLCMVTVEAQNGLSGTIAPLSSNTKINSNKDKIKALVILKTDTGDVKTNNILAMATDIEKMDLPSKTEVSKTLGPIEEDVVVVITLKKDVNWLRLPALLAKYHIDAKYSNLPVCVDDKLLTHPGPVIIAEPMVKAVNFKNTQIHITTHNGKGALGLN